MAGMTACGSLYGMCMKEAGGGPSGACTMAGGPAWMGA